MKSITFLAGSLCAATVLTSCVGGDHDRRTGERSVARQTPPSPPAPPGIDAAAPCDLPGVHNVVAYHEGFLAGGAPEGDLGFDTLAGLGVRTIISVDGSVPDVAKARARGLRYIHLPIGYNGFDEARKLELVRAVRDCLFSGGSGGGGVYLHCHHGKHRAAGAAATVAASLGWMTPAQAVARMKVSGTAPNYTGLYSCASSAVPLEAGAIDAAPSVFPEVSRPSGFVRTMIDIDEANERLKAIEKAGWRAPPQHPDLVPAAEAGRMADHFRVLGEGEKARSKPEDFRAMLADAASRAGALEAALSSGGGGGGKTDAANLSARFKLVAASCKECHGKYRD